MAFKNEAGRKALYAFMAGRQDWCRYLRMV